MCQQSLFLFLLLCTRCMRAGIQALAYMWSSEYSFVELVLSIYLYLSSEKQLGPSCLYNKHFIHRAFSLAFQLLPSWNLPSWNLPYSPRAGGGGHTNKPNAVPPSQTSLKSFIFNGPRPCLGCLVILSCKYAKLFLKASILSASWPLLLCPCMTPLPLNDNSSYSLCLLTLLVHLCVAPLPWHGMTPLLESWCNNHLFNSSCPLISQPSSTSHLFSFYLFFTGA